jgi:septal ring factor EnvC (AmiA/AmiB activator)
MLFFCKKIRGGMSYMEKTQIVELSDELKEAIGNREFVRAIVIPKNGKVAIGVVANVVDKETQKKNLNDRIKKYEVKIKELEGELAKYEPLDPKVIEENGNLRRTVARVERELSKMKEKNKKAKDKLKTL